MQFLSAGCGKSVILPVCRFCFAFRRDLRPRIAIPIKKLMRFLFGIGISSWPIIPAADGFVSQGEPETPASVPQE
jgi:hypothetical protein